MEMETVLRELIEKTTEIREVLEYKFIYINWDNHYIIHLDWIHGPSIWKISVKPSSNSQLLAMPKRKATRNIFFLEECVDECATKMAEMENYNIQLQNQLIEETTRVRWIRI